MTSLEPHRNIEGHDLYNIQLNPGDTEYACGQDCCFEAECQAFVFVAKGYGRNGNCNDAVGPCCWFKDTQVPPQPSSIPGVVAGTVQGPAPSAPTTVGLAVNMPLPPTARLTVYYPGKSQ